MPAARPVAHLPQVPPGRGLVIIHATRHQKGPASRIRDQRVGNNVVSWSTITAGCHCLVRLGERRTKCNAHLFQEQRERREHFRLHRRRMQRRIVLAASSWGSRSSRRLLSMEPLPHRGKFVRNTSHIASTPSIQAVHAGEMTSSLDGTTSGNVHPLSPVRLLRLESRAPPLLPPAPPPFVRPLHIRVRNYMTVTATTCCSHVEVSCVRKLPSDVAVRTHSPSSLHASSGSPRPASLVPVMHPAMHPVTHSAMHPAMHSVRPMAETTNGITTFSTHGLLAAPVGEAQRASGKPAPPVASFTASTSRRTRHLKNQAAATAPRVQPRLTPATTTPHMTTYLLARFARFPTDPPCTSPRFSDERTFAPGNSSVRFTRDGPPLCQLREVSSPRDNFGSSSLAVDDGRPLCKPSLPSPSGEPSAALPAVEPYSTTPPQARRSRYPSGCAFLPGPGRFLLENSS